MPGARVLFRAERCIAALLIGLGVAFYGLWEVSHRGVYAYAPDIYGISDADEWRYTACSRLVAHGYHLFDQVFSAQPPLLFAALAGGMKVFGDTIDGARWVEVIFGLLFLLCCAGLAARIAGPIAAGSCCVVLAISPGFLVYFHTIEAEGPMMALAALSLLLLTVRSRRHSELWALAAGVALAASILTKLFAVEAVLPGLWLVVSVEKSIRASLPRLLAYGAGIAVPVAANFAFISPSRQWQQVVVMHDRATTIMLPDLIPAHEVVRTFLTLDVGMTVLAFSGLAVLALTSRWRHLVFLSLWLLGTVSMLLLFRPLFPHHAAILLAPLGVCAGVAVGTVFEAVKAGEKRALLVGAAALLYLGFVPGLAHADRHILVPQSYVGTVALAAYIDARTGAGEFVAVDDLHVADVAHRFVPPPLCDPSTVRLRSGYLTAADLISSTRDYRTAMVVPIAGIYRQVPRYMSWLSRHYRAVWPHGLTQPSDLVVYVRRRAAAS